MEYQNTRHSINSILFLSIVLSMVKPFLEVD